MSETTTKKDLLENVDKSVAIVGYISAAVGLFLVLGITFCVLRRIRLRRAKKYIKQQRNHSIAMGPVLTSKPPTSPWKWKEVKANIKARRKGDERPYSAGDKRPTVAVISEQNTATVNVTNRPQTAIITSTSLGQRHKKMYGEESTPKVHVSHHVKHERLQRRIKAKAERREMKERQKEIKKDLALLLEGQKLPGDEFPAASASTSITHVGPIRRESLYGIPNLTYLIEQSPRDKGVHRSTGLKQLDIPQNLCTWEEERESKSSSRSNLSAGRLGSSPRHVLGSVTVHHVRDEVHDDDNITEL